jgi:hypothetical protein
MFRGWPDGILIIFPARAKSSQPDIIQDLDRGSFRLPYIAAFDNAAGRTKFYPRFILIYRLFPSDSGK